MFKEANVPMKRLLVRVDSSKCRNCGFCRYVNTCYSPRECTGCLSCYWACPYSARYTVEKNVEERSVEIVVNGVKARVPAPATVAEALRYLGFELGKPGSRKTSLSCKTGGCWSCAVVINGALERSCIMPVREGMRIDTDTGNFIPLRIVHGPEPHVVGGKATPWWEVDYVHYVEAAVWVAGCNLRCPQCQNYHVTYDNVTTPLSPMKAAELLVACHRRYSTRGVAVSGGEPTINRKWLVEFFREVSRRVGPRVRRHLDSNGTVLTPDYVDELVDAGCNNIGVEPKCLRADTYMKVTGILDREVAVEYLNTAWRAIQYIYEYYGDRVYLGVGLVYNSDLVTLEEIREAGSKIASIDPRIQVTVLDYFPSFRRTNMRRPSAREMLLVKRALEEQGLKTVIVQTEHGHLGPGDRNMRLVEYEL